MKKMRVRRGGAGSRAGRGSAGSEHVKDLPGLVTFALVLYALGALWLLSVAFQQPHFPWLHTAGTVVLGGLAAGMTFRQNWARSLSALFWLGVMIYGLYSLFVPPYDWVTVLIEIGMVLGGLYLSTGMISVEVLRSFGVTRHWMLELTAARQESGKEP